MCSLVRGNSSTELAVTKAPLNFGSMSSSKWVWGLHRVMLHHGGLFEVMVVTDLGEPFSHSMGHWGGYSSLGRRTRASVRTMVVD